MPPELLHDRREHPRGVERHAAAIMQLPATEEMVEPQPADAEPMPAAKLGRRHVGVGDRNAPQPAGLACQRVEHGRVVGPVRAALHQNAAGKAERVEHGKIVFERRVRRGVAAIGGIGKARGGPEHVGMGVARPGRERDPRPARRTRGGTGGDHARTFNPIDTPELGKSVILPATKNTPRRMRGLSPTITSYRDREGRCMRRLLRVIVAAGAALLAVAANAQGQLRSAARPISQQAGHPRRPIRSRQHHRHDLAHHRAVSRKRAQPEHRHREQAGS